MREFYAKLLKARLLDLDKLKILSSLWSEEAQALYSKGWNIFGGTKNDDSPYYGRNHTNTIAMPGDEGNSPINNGFSIIYSQILNKADELTNGTAILSDEDGNAYLVTEWAKAYDAFLFAAMAIAYQNSYNKKEIEILSGAWVAVYGELPLMA